VQDRSAVNLAAAEGVAVRELPSGGGEADYGLFLGRELVGVVEAKRSEGGYALVVDAKDAAAAEFYLRHGFRAYRDTPGSLYLPLGG
jgi:hypothetical protein